MADDRRAILEAVAFGDQPDVKPADRLKALEQLAELDGGLPVEVLALAREVHEMSDDALDKELVGLTQEPPRRKHDHSREVERRVAERVHTIVRADELPPTLQERVEREVTQRVEQLIADGELVRAADAVEKKPPPSPDAPPGLEPEDLGPAWAESGGPPVPVRVQRGSL